MSFTKNLAVSALAVGIVAASSMAHAEQAAGSYYVGGSLARGFNAVDKNRRADMKEAGFVSEMNKVGLKAFAGYNVNSAVAVEGGFAYFGKPTNHLESRGLKASGSATLSSVYVAGVFSAPMAEKITGFAKAGLALNRASRKGDVTNGFESVHVSKTGSSIRPMIGVGMSYAVNKNVAVRGELEYFGRMGKDTVVKSTMLSAGVVCSF